LQGKVYIVGVGPGNIEMLLDVDLEITVELDRKTMLVSDLLKLGKGSIIEFPKSAGEPLDILVNGRKFAEGEVVVIDDKFGVRITQLISPKERIKKLA
jgi:flagellar motor switch protein FliN/FliY